MQGASLHSVHGALTKLPRLPLAFTAAPTAARSIPIGLAGGDGSSRREKNMHHEPTQGTNFPPCAATCS